MTTLPCASLGCACACHRAVKRRPPIVWTHGMDRRLRAAIERGEHPEVIADGMALSLEAIRWRVKTLGLSLRDGWRSRQEVQAALGAPRRAVDRWMRDGHLRVTRHGTRWTRVTDDDLRAFVGTHAGVLFDPGCVEDPQLRSLAETAAMANRRRAAS
jgi:hypothetical protein